MEEKQKAKDSFISYLQNPDNANQRFWQALRNWAFDYYKNQYESGEKPEIHNIYAGFDKEACEDTFFWD